MSKRFTHILPSVVLYIAAGLVAAYATWAYSYCTDIISQARAAGQLAVSGNEYDIASFYMINCGQYVVFALLLAAAGVILQRKSISQQNPNTIIQSINNEVSDAELDEWFNESESESGSK